MNTFLFPVLLLCFFAQILSHSLFSHQCLSLRPGTTTEWLLLLLLRLPPKAKTCRGRRSLSEGTSTGHPTPSLTKYPPSTKPRGWPPSLPKTTTATTTHRGTKPCRLLLRGLTKPSRARLHPKASASRGAKSRPSSSCCCPEATHPTIRKTGESARLTLWLLWLLLLLLLRLQSPPCWGTAKKARAKATSRTTKLSCGGSAGQGRGMLRLLLLLLLPLNILRKIKPSITLWHLVLLKNRLPHARVPICIFSPQFCNLRNLRRLILLIKFPHSIHWSQARKSLSPCCYSNRRATKASRRPATKTRGSRRGWRGLLLLLLLAKSKPTTTS